jgi:hypothetical protein
MSKKRCEVNGRYPDVQAQAWFLQLVPLDLEVRAQHQALARGLGLNPPDAPGRRVSFVRIRQWASSVAVQLELAVDATTPGAGHDAGDGVPVQSDEGGRA